MKTFFCFLSIIYILVPLFLFGSTNPVFAATQIDKRLNVISQTKLDIESFNCEEVTMIPKSECLALLDLYASTNGAGWLHSDNWLESRDVSKWYGLIVTDNHVTSMILESNQLSGEISASLSDLLFLVEICFVGNELTGSIPETLGQLKNLERLSLGNNQLTGSLPASIGSIPYLFKLSVDNNLLTGSLPDSLGNLSSLYRLEVHHNQLSGALPESLGQLSNLEIMIVSNNSFSGPIPLSFTKLGNLDFFYFMFTDLCEPATKEYLLWKTKVFEYHGTDLICMDFHCFMPIIIR